MEEKSMMEERKTVMAPAAGGDHLIFRSAYFLTPTHTHRQFAAAPPSSDTTRSSANVVYQGWRGPQKDWERWVQRLEPLYGDIWKTAGIYDAIMASTYEVVKGRGNKNLVLKLAQKWCPETNTFVFPWGECTITLEDVMVLGEFSVLGDTRPYGSAEMLHVEKKLDFESFKLSKKAGAPPRESTWLQHFMGGGDEILEHEAFLVLWLTRFVFPNSSCYVEKGYFLLAINLSRGIRIAFGPAVLASIYRDLGSLKRVSLKDPNECEKLVLFSPLGVVQIWAWERFPKLSPEPNLLELGQPRVARWCGVRPLDFGDSEVDQVLSSSEVDFKCRPYTGNLTNWDSNKLYDGDEGCFVMAGPDMDSEPIKTLVRFWRNSELVAGADCEVEQYLPHRVGMQFGFDQDVPVTVERIPNLAIPDLAWSHHNRQVKDDRIYIPGRLRQPGVTQRYLEKWIRAQATGDDPNPTSESVKTPVCIAVEDESESEVPLSSGEANGDDGNLASGSAKILACIVVQDDADSETPLSSGEANGADQVMEDEGIADQVSLEAEPEGMEICEEHPLVAPSFGPNEGVSTDQDGNFQENVADLSQTNRNGSLEREAEFAAPDEPLLMAEDVANGLASEPRPGSSEAVGSSSSYSLEQVRVMVTDLEELWAKVKAKHSSSAL